MASNPMSHDRRYNRGTQPAVCLNWALGGTGEPPACHKSPSTAITNTIPNGFLTGNMPRQQATCRRIVNFNRFLGFSLVAFGDDSGT